MEVQSYSTPPSPKYPIHSPPSPVLIPSSLISQRVAESHVFMSEVNGHRCRDRLRLQEWCRVRCRSHTSPGSHFSRRLRTMSAPHFQLLSHHSPGTYIVTPASICTEGTGDTSTGPRPPSPFCQVLKAALRGPQGFNSLNILPRT